MAVLSRAWLNRVATTVIGLLVGMLAAVPWSGWDEARSPMTAHLVAHIAALDEVDGEGPEEVDATIQTAKQALEGSDDYLYTPIGKRDPFRPRGEALWRVGTDARVPCEPEELTLQDIVHTGGWPALGVCPDGKGHVFRRGTQIGAKGARYASLSSGGGLCLRVEGPDRDPCRLCLSRGDAFVVTGIEVPEYSTACPGSDRLAYCLPKPQPIRVTLLPPRCGQELPHPGVMLNGTIRAHDSESQEWVYVDVLEHAEVVNAPSDAITEARASWQVDIHLLISSEVASSLAVAMDFAGVDRLELRMAQAVER